MQNTGPGTYDYETYDVYGQAGVGAGGAAVADAAAATYPPSNNADYNQYSQQDYGYSSNQGHDYPQQDPGVPPIVTGAAAGLRDGMMARVQVGFNRTLEDELGTLTITRASSVVSRAYSYSDRSWTAAMATHSLR